MRRTARSCRFGGIVYAGTSQPRSRSARDRSNTSYFVPDRRVRAALFRTVRRGVPVRVLVPAKSDVPVVQFAVEALFDELLEKSAVVDALRADAGLREPFRSVAVQIAQGYSPHPGKLNVAAWAVVKRPGANSDAYALALRRAGPHRVGPGPSRNGTFPCGKVERFS